MINFSVSLYDECYDTTVGPASSLGLQPWPLNMEAYVDFVPSYSTKECGVITYSLTYLNADGLDPIIQISQNPVNTLFVLGTDAENHAGQHYLRIKSCITVYSQGEPSYCENCCADSQPFIVELIDLCPGA